MRYFWYTNTTTGPQWLGLSQPTPRHQGVSRASCTAGTRPSLPDTYAKFWAVKIVATRCQILTLKCTKIDFGWGCTSDPAGGAYSGFKGATSKGRTWEGRGFSTCLPPRFDNPGYGPGTGGGYGAREGRGKGGRRRKGWVGVPLCEILNTPLISNMPHRH